MTVFTWGHKYLRKASPQSGFEQSTPECESNALQPHPEAKCTSFVRVISPTDGVKVCQRCIWAV